MKYRDTLKPLLDRSCAVILFLVLSPILVIGLVLAMMASRGLPIFAHQRPGLNGEPFTLYKLRTMRPANSQGRLMTNMERITPLGHFLRNWSIDEFPQLINVMKGDISLIGPRPLEMRYLQSYSEDQMRRHEVKPGITGLAQVNGRNCLSWEEKFELDIQYVENISFTLDIKILLKTVVQLFRRSGINSGDDHTMKPFS